MIGADLLQLDLFDDARGLADQRTFRSLDHLDLGIVPVDVGKVRGLAHGAAQHFGMLLVQGHVLFDLALGDEATNAGAAAFVHFLADPQLLLGEAQHLVMDLGRLRGHGDGLHRGQRRGSNLLHRGFDMRYRSDAGGDGTVLHVNRAVHVEDARGMGNFALGHADRHNSAALLDRCAINMRLVLEQVAAEQAVPNAGLTERGRIGAPEAAAIEDADVVSVEAAGLERPHRGSGVVARIKGGNDGLDRHVNGSSRGVVVRAGSRVYPSPSGALAGSRVTSASW